MALSTLSSSQEVVDAMQEAFKTYWAARPVVTEIIYDNTPGNLPDRSFNITSSTNSDLPITDEAVVLLQVLHAGGAISALGTKRFRLTGIINAAIYCRTSVGRKRSGGILADQALEFFQTQNVANVVFQSPRINEVGEDGRWWQVNVLADFLYDIRRS